MRRIRNAVGADRPASTQRVCLVAIMIGSLLVVPGCHIPGLRCALPGPAMPNQYLINNGAAPWDHETNDPGDREYGPKSDSESSEGSDDDSGKSSVDNADEAVPRLKKFFDPIRLTGLMRPSKSAQADEAGENPHAKATTDVVTDDGEGKADSDQTVTVSHSVTVSDSDTGSPTPADGQTATSSATDTGDPLNTISPSTDVTVFPPADPDAEGMIEGSSAQIARDAFFSDPVLSGLIGQALTGNQELRILAEEINIAGNETYARSGEYRPFVTLGAGAGLDKTSRFSREGAVEDQLTAAPGKGFPEPLPNFLVAANVSWELDIWKKLRNAQNAAAMRYLGSQEGRNYIVTRMVADVAENYYDLLALDNRLVNLNRTIEIQEKSLEISKAKKAAGRGTELAVQRFQAEVRKNQSEIRVLQQDIVEAENRINLLLGRYPQPVERDSSGFIDLNLTALSTGFPSQLLQNRADIRQAERDVAAAGFDVKVARARFYPNLGLEAGVGLNAFNMRYLLSTPESFVYNAAIGLVGPVINRRAIKADYCSANAAQLQTIYNYQRTVLTAYIEVVNHMTKSENYRRSIEVKKQQLQALEASVESANQLFQNARAEYVEVLLAQRELMEARMQLIDIKRDQLSAIVNAYQALGGGAF